MKKVPKIIFRIFAAILGLFLLVILGLNVFYRINYYEFYRTANKEFRIPGLAAGFTPQGLTVDDEGTFLTCGYMKDGSASRIYVINDQNTYVRLVNEDGTEDLNHAGGLAVYGDYLYLTNGDSINVYRYADILNSENGGRVTPVYGFNIDLESAFIHIENNKLYVGEFYREGNYPTAASHHVTTDSGDRNDAILAVFPLPEDTEYGIKSELPECIYSIRGLAQGICFTESGRLCLSTSYGVASSKIFIYEDPAVGEADGMFETGGAQVPLYYLDSSHLQDTVKLFPMTEELVRYGSRIYIMDESACSKYIFGKFTGNSFVYSFYAA